MSVRMPFSGGCASGAWGGWRSHCSWPAAPSWASRGRGRACRWGFIWEGRGRLSGRLWLDCGVAFAITQRPRDSYGHLSEHVPRTNCLLPIGFHPGATSACTFTTVPVGKWLALVWSWQECGNHKPYTGSAQRCVFCSCRRWPAGLGQCGHRQCPAGCEPRR